MSPPIIRPDEGHEETEPPTLFAPGGLTNRGFLILPVRDALGERRYLSVGLRPAQMRAIAVLTEAMREDQHLPRNARGWRRVEKLAESIDRLWGYTLEKESIRSYLTAIRRAVREAALQSPGIQLREVIEHQNGLGARLGWPDLRIIDGADPGRDVNRS